MSVSDFATLRDELRSAIRDDYDLLWSDAELDEIINEAQREYSLYTGTLTASVTVFSTENEVHDAPPDFIEPIQFINHSGYEIPIVSWQKLNVLYPDFRKVTGNCIQAVCFDFDGYKKFRFFPKTPPGESGTLFYRRTAKKNKIDTRNREAIKQHALFQIFMLTGKSAFENYWKNFLMAVNREARSPQTMRNRKDICGGRFY